MVLFEEDKRHVWFYQVGILGHMAENSTEVLHLLFLRGWVGGENYFDGEMASQKPRFAIPAVSFLRVYLENNIYQDQSTEDEML